MKRLFNILFIVVAVLISYWQSKAQTIVDTVCAGETGNVYWVTGSPGSVFIWNVTGAGSVLYLNDSIHVSWGIIPGSYPMSVTETSLQGCIGEMVSGNILVLPVPWVNLGADTSVCANAGFVLDAGSAGNNYLWQDGSTGQYMSVATSGLFWVLVSNSVGCSDADSIIVNLMQPPDINLGQDTSLCNGMPVFLDAGSGYNYYQWSDGSLLQTLLVTLSGTYSVTVSDQNGCTDADTVNVIISPPFSLSSVVTNITCNSGNNGSIDLSITGGVPPFAFSWSNGATTQDLINLGAGYYVVTVTDTVGCIATGSWTVIQTDAIIITSAITNVSCNNLSDGSIDITVTGGTSPYLYQWSNNSVNQDISGLTGGIYLVTVTDSHGCIQIDSITVINPADLTSVIIPVNLSCYNSGDGQADMTVTGGTPPYNYLWSYGYTTEDLSNIPAGAYFVMIFDSNNCMDINNITISQPTIIVSSITGVSVSCAGYSDGSVNLTVSGGTPSYTYHWSNNMTTEDIAGLTDGMYSVTVTDLHNCLHYDSIYISVPLPLNVTFFDLPVQCFGGSDGSINITVTGGTTPYHYLWSNGQTIEDISGLITGIYYVTVTDNHLCIITGSDTIVQPSSLISATAVASPVSCYGGINGSVNLTVSGGISPYYYQWSNGSSTEDVTGLPAGNYIVTVIDNNLCHFTTSVIVSGPSAPVSIYSSVTNVNCFGNFTGAVNILVTGGTSPYTFAWSNGATSEDIANVNAGVYYVTVTDFHTCTATSAFTISQPALINLFYTQINVNCYGGSNGSVNLTVIGGAAPYTYLWSNNATTQDIFNLQAGQYTVTVNDANGCPPALTSVTITQPQNALNIQINVTNVSCYGGIDGAINVTVTGGIQPYTFLWSNSVTTEDISGIPAGTYSISVTDYNNCFITGITQVSQPSTLLSMTYQTGSVSCHGSADGFIDITVSGGTSPYSFIWSNNATTEDIQNIGAGNYFVTISDFNSCILAQSFTISQPLLLVLDAQVTDVSCFADSTGSVDLAVTGGIVPYEILWSNGETTEDITGLPAGIYTVSVTDGNECLGTGSYNVSEPSSLISVNIISTDLNCFSDTSGAADLTVSGGNAPYNYLWSNGATTQDLEGLTMGSYIVTVSDSGLCSVTSDAYIGPANQVTAEAMISSNYNGFAVSCYGASDGNINLDINGGTPPYNILWSNGMNNQNLYNVDAGYYQVTVTDITGCKDIDTVVLVSPPQLSISETVAYPTCPDFADGSVVITVTGGLEPYSYLWSNLEVTPSITGIPAGIYTITVSDANNCFLTDELNLPNLFEECIFIPSAFTPNNDGFNDVWNIRGIELYPQTIIEVFNRWGQLLFKSDIGYHEKWDGKYNGNELPSDTYHYVVTLKEGMEPIIGTVTIIR